ncbi:uncharacterized protein [Prorops nasuta]|uniref:uncharacterized protein n=1 Tax=Prorops nasuta TaxID=863751 RepID=UPI0034CFC42A
MSLCIRTISNKFAPFANTRKPVAQIDRQLAKPSTFLEEFLGTKVTLDNKGQTGVINTTVSCTVQQRSLAKLNLLKIPSNQHKLLVDQNNLLQAQLLKYPEHRPNRINILNEYFPYGSNSGLVWNMFEKKEYELRAVNFVKDGNPILNESSNQYKKVQKNDKQIPGRPSEEQLETVFNVLSTDLPALFVKSVNYEIYHNDIIFINNINGSVTNGLVNYAKQIIWLKIVGHIKFAHVKKELIKITKHPEDGVIKVRWRIRGVSGTKVMFTFWKFNIFKLRDQIKELEVWYDGFSTYYVGSDGKVYKHVVDKMMPDDNPVIDSKAAIAPKLALFSALAYFNGYSINSLMSKLKFPNIDFRIKRKLVE